MRSALVVVALAGVASADPLAIDPETRPREPLEPVPVTAEPERPLTAADVHGAPRPGQEHGRTDAIDEPDGAARRLGRSLLWIPRFPIMLAAQPIRGLAYLQDHYDVATTIPDQFQTEDKHIAIYPTALFETGFGLNVGARARFTDLFGGGERITARVGFGGQYRRLGVVEVGTSRGLLGASIDARYELADAEYFYGYGNGDVTAPAMPVDPLTTVAESEYRVRVLRASPRLRLQLPHAFALTATGAVVHKDFAAGDAGALSIDQVFELDRIPGFPTGTTFLYDELELAWDTRRQAHRWDAPGIRGTGGFVLAFAGRQRAIEGDDLAFYRLGFDVQRFVRLTVGPRVLEFRAYGELVTGPRDAVPFTELPRLGGASLLRGYRTDRFRDRVAVVTQATYRWAVSTFLAPEIFVDAGRVYSGLDALTLDDLRVGYGAGLELYGRRSLAMRAELATSIDGGALVYLSLAPASDARSRGGRY